MIARVWLERNKPEDETVSLIAASAASTASADKPLEKLNLECKVELQVFVFTRASFWLAPIKSLRLLEEKVEEL